MALPSTSATISYAGNGTGPYPIPFKFFSNDHIEFYADGVLVPTGYSITGAGADSGGELTTVDSYDPAVKLTINRVVPLDQPYLYREGDPLPAKTLEDNSDYLAMQTQQVKEVQDRSIKFQVGSGETPEIPRTPNTIISLDALGNPVPIEIPLMTDAAAIQAARDAAAASAVEAEAAQSNAETAESNAEDAQAAAEAAQSNAETAEGNAETAETNAETAQAAAEAALAAVNIANSAGHVGFQTKALMNADLAHDADTLAEVTNDDVDASANNGTYIKVGASGVGSWLKSTSDVSGRVSTNESDISALDARVTVIEDAESPAFVFTEGTPTERLLSGDKNKVLSKGGLLSLDANTFPLDATVKIICSSNLEVVAASKGDIIGENLLANRAGFLQGSVIEVRNIGGGNWLVTPGGQAFVLSPQTDYGFTSLHLSDQNTILSGSDVTRWSSVEAGGYDLENAAYPANVPSVGATSLNGLDTLSFAITGNEFLDHTFSSPLTGQNTIVMLCKNDTIGRTSTLFDGISTGGRILLRQESSNTYRQLVTAASDGGTVDTNWNLVVAEFNGASSSVEINNVTVSSGNPGSLNATGIRLGVSNTLGADFEGEMALFGHIEGAWDSTQKANFISWVNNRYGLSI